MIANRVAGPGPRRNVGAQRWECGRGYLRILCRRTPEFALPERHLGLFQARARSPTSDTRLDSAARAIEACGRYQPPMVAFHAQEDDDVAAAARWRTRSESRATPRFPSSIRPTSTCSTKLARGTGVFLPLEHDAIPTVDSLWFPGGYPELHLDRLAANNAMKKAIRAHHEDGKPILAECGGMLYPG